MVSDTLAPVAYINSRIALSLMPSGFDMSTASSNLSTSATVSTSGIFLFTDCTVKASVGSLWANLLRIRNPQNVLNAEMFREIDDLASPRSER